MKRLVETVCLALLLLPVGVLAEEARNPAKAAYLRYCSACHGESAKGDGVVSQLMTPHPSDLTVLAKNNKGEFPYAQMMRVVDGRQAVRAHGDPDMPVWGEIFKAEAGASLAEEAQVRGKVFLVVEHLSTIQVK